MRDVLLRTAEPQLRNLVTQGHEGASVSNRAAQGASSAVASSLLEHPITYRFQNRLPYIAPPSVPTSATHSSTVQSDVRAGAIRVAMSGPEQWSSGDVAILQNQEAKRVREIGSLIFETPMQHDYEAGVEVRSLVSTEELEEIDVKLAAVDVDSTGNRFSRFWVDGPPGVPTEGRTTTPAAEEHAAVRSSQQFQARVPPFPLFTEGTVERAPRTPERRASSCWFGDPSPSSSC